MAEELRLLIEKLVYGGDGLGHGDGNTVFVPYVLPGEEVRAKEKSKKKKLIRTELVEVVTPSRMRQKALCPHFQKCGGCHYQHIPAAQQVQFKKEILRETLSRLGGVSWGGEICAHTAEPYGYRNRAQWAVRSGMPRALGYFLPESSAIIPIDQCQVLSPRLATAFGRLQDMARGGSLPAEILEIEAFADSRDEKIALNVAFKQFPQPAAALAATIRTGVPGVESLLLLDQGKNRFELTGPGFLTQEAGGYCFHVSHLSFFQVNRFLTEALLHTVTTGAKGAFALDLYSGVGFFTLPLARSFQRVVSVDANLAAMRDLRLNAEAAGMQVTSHNEHVERFLEGTTEKPDLVVLDPPRAGLGADAAARLAGLGAPEIFYLSCDPATLARDLAVLLGTPKKPAGLSSDAVRYEISEMHLFELFPQTYHIEAFVKLRRVP